MLWMGSEHVQSLGQLVLFPPSHPQKRCYVGLQCSSTLCSYSKTRGKWMGVARFLKKHSNVEPCKLETDPSKCSRSGPATIWTCYVVATCSWGNILHTPKDFLQKIFNTPIKMGSLQVGCCRKAGWDGGWSKMCHHLCATTRDLSPSLHEFRWPLFSFDH